MEIPGQEKRRIVENWFRAFLAENWFYLEGAIREAMQSSGDEEEVPYLVVTNFYERMAKPRYASDILTATEQQLKC